MTERRIAIFTSGRHDWGLLRGTVLAMQAHPEFRPLVWAGGHHRSRRHGQTIDLLRAEGIPITRELPAAGVGRNAAHDAALMLATVADAITADRPEALLLLGDRTETAAAALAASMAVLPIIHLHGGEESEGAVDNALRHAITKLAHLHLVSHPLHAERVRQMGEPAESVIVVGPPGVDNLLRDDLADEDELASILGAPLVQPVVLVTHHPATLGASPADEAMAIALALRDHPGTIIITQPNGDTGADAIRAVWQSFATAHHDVRVVDALGERRYWGLLKLASIVVGNSSSGIIEAPAAGIPSLTVGDRQRGRLMPAGVCEVPADADAIRQALIEQLAGFGHWSSLTATPYPDGPVAPRILAAIAAWTPPSPARKRFESLACAV